jgi:Response regulator receiver domain
MAATHVAIDYRTQELKVEVFTDGTNDSESVNQDRSRSSRDEGANCALGWPDGSRARSRARLYSARLAPSRRYEIVKGIRLKVVIADDQALVRAGFRMILESQPDIEVVAEAGDGEEAIAACRRYRPDVALIDVRTPRLNGIEATRRIWDSGGIGSQSPDLDDV